MKQIFTVLLAMGHAINVMSQTDEKKINVNGIVESDNISYYNEKKGKVNARNQILSQINLKSSSTNKMLFSSVEFREDLADKNRNRVYIDEAYFSVNFKNLDFIAGKQIIQWGTADAINPTNNINGVDYSDLFDTDDEDIGTLALNLKYYINDWEIQALSYSFTPSIMPDHTSRWFIDPPSRIPYEADPSIILKAGYTYNTIMPEYTLQNTQYALKVKRTFGGWDLSASYNNGFYDLPEISNKVSSVGIDSLSINVAQNYYKRQVFGFDFATSFDKLGLRFESALLIPENKSMYAHSYIQYAVGMDRRFTIGDRNSIWFIAQWADEIVVNSDRYSTLGLEHLFQQTTLLRAELAFGDKFKFAFSSFNFLMDEAYYLRPEIEVNFFDGIKANISADFIGGKEGSLFHLYNENNRAQLKLKYYF